ncbi:MAG: endolytic transglycosylase MltG [Rickettsiales bacterium]|jgi:UPF0755 protein|nr:endolytic transglycosylase MltG [Rickettsiales bacterium]
MPAKKKKKSKKINSPHAGESKNRKRFFGGGTKRNFLAQLLIIVILATGASLFNASFIHSPIVERTEFMVAPGASISKVSNDLRAQNLIGSEFLFKVSVQFWGGRVQSGLYEMKPGQSVWRVARDLSRGRIAMTMITIPEGLTAKQIYEIVGKHPGLAGEVRILYKDGELFPDTYGVAKGADRNKVLVAMADKMARVREKYENQLPENIKDWNELLSLAAIIQKETSKPAEMPRVSGVYSNRLKTGMKLQADPTVVYAITDGWGHMQGRAIYRKHLEIDSPFNTYKYKGLPPTPIANPGMQAIQAALNPEQHGYFYFVADGTGGHIFAETYEEHQVNHANWREIRKGLNEPKD